MESQYERALKEIGSNSFFQKRFDVIYNVMLASLWVMAYNNIILALTVTPHTCKLPDKPENISESSWKIKHIPVTEDAAGKLKFSECLIYTVHGINETMECHDYDYETKWYETTIPSDNNWVCDKEMNVANIFAYSKIGEAVGSLIFGWFSDVYGRKLTYIIALALLILGRFITVIASSSYTLFVIGCIVATFPSWSVVQNTAVISLEISSPERRSTVAQLHLVSFSIGMFLMPFIYWWLRNWKAFIVVTTITQLPPLLLSWKLIESPQWLWVNRKSKACIQQLKIISKLNETKLNPDTEGEILTAPPMVSSNIEVLGPLALFSGLRLTLHTLLQLCLWISVSVSYTAILMSSGEKSDGNPFLEFAWQSLAEIPGYIIAPWLADRIGRRYTSVTACSITAFLWALHSFRENGISGWMRNGWLSTILVMANRCCITISYYIVNLLNMELYPTCLRQSGMSLGNVISGAGSALAPYVLLLGRRYDSRYPGAILAIITLTGGVMSSFFLPETLNTKLPETLDDAKNFGGRNDFFKTVHNGSKTDEIENDVNA